MPRDLGKFTPKRPHKLVGPMLTMALNAVHDRLAGRVFVLQIGANDGQTGAPLLDRFRHHGWSGLLIEPHPVFFQALSDLHRDSERVAVLNLGIAAEAGTQPLYHLTGPAAARFPAEMAAKATLDPARLQTSPAAASPNAEDIAFTDVPLLRLDVVLRELGIDRVDMIVVNAGGRELDVLASFDLAALNPTAVLVDCSGASPAEDAAAIAALTAAGLQVFRIAHRLLGIRPQGLAVPLDELFCFFGLGQGAVE